jgi:radical SAM superfamily enzyme YgiQ (UPF0313 family)
MESGSDTILRLVNKGITSADLLTSGRNAKAAGIEISEFIILGLGGRELSRENALATARVLNEIDPDYIRVRTIRVKPGTALDRLRLEGKYTLQSEEEIIAEQRLLVENLDATGYLSNDHSMNLLLEVEGRLPEQKEELLAKLDKYLALPPEDKVLFNIGSRLGYFRNLQDIGDASRRALARKAAGEMDLDDPDKRNEIYNCLRIKYS